MLLYKTSQLGSIGPFHTPTDLVASIYLQCIVEHVFSLNEKGAYLLTLCIFSFKDKIDQMKQWMTRKCQKS